MADNNSELLRVRVTPALRERAVALANGEGMSLSELVRSAIRRELQAASARLRGASA